jgi:protein-S-isoprenylcysteine O-methyltransferase Ste14
MRRLLPPVLLLVLIVSMVVTHRQLDASVVVPDGVRRASVALVVVGLAVALIARLQFARARTTIHTFRQPKQLVTGGLFRYSRNPMYVGLALVGLGAGFWCGAVSSLALALSFIVVTDRWYIPFEEKLLQTTFGSAFDAYAGKVRRWL